MRGERPVPSSVIRDYAYDAETRVLTITFVSGQVYAYREVPPEVHAGLKAATSRGRYFSNHIRDRYPFMRGGGRGEPPDPPPEPAPVRPRGPSSPNSPLLAYAEPPAPRRRTRAGGRTLRRTPSPPA